MAWLPPQLPTTRDWTAAGSVENVVPFRARPLPAEYVVLRSSPQPQLPAGRLNFRVCPARQPCGSSGPVTVIGRSSFLQAPPPFFVEVGSITRSVESAPTLPCPSTW